LLLAATVQSFAHLAAQDFLITTDAKILEKEVVHPKIKNSKPNY